MTKAELLDVIKLLSALEAWGFSMKETMPDYLLEDVDRVVERLSREVLK